MRRVLLRALFVVCIIMYVLTPIGYGVHVHRRIAKHYYVRYISSVESLNEKKGSVHILSYTDGIEYMYYRSHNGIEYYGIRNVLADSYEIFKDDHYEMYDKAISKLIEVYKVSDYKAYRVRMINECLPIMAGIDDVLLDFETKDNFYAVMYKDRDAVSVIYNWDFSSNAYSDDAFIVFYDLNSDVKIYDRNDSKWKALINELR